MKTNLIKIIIGVIILAAIIAAGALLQGNDENNNAAKLVNGVSEEANELSITADIDNGEIVMSYDKKVSSGTTALEVLNLISEEDGIVLGTTEYDFGILIDSIDSVGEDTEDGKYWSFYVNDEMPGVGVADYAVNDNDRILMKYQSF